jgi:hypothetical protein
MKAGDARLVEDVLVALSVRRPDAHRLHGLVPVRRRRDRAVIRADGDEREAAPRDELARDPGTHSIELARAMGRFTEQDDAGVGDPLQQRIDGRRLDLVDGLGNLAHGRGQCGDSGEFSWRMKEAGLLTQALFYDGRDELDVRNVLLAKLGLALAGDADERLPRTDQAPRA